MKINSRHLIVLVSFLSVMFGGVGEVFAMPFADYVYMNVKRGNESDVKKYLSKGYNIDAVNPQGYTALCMAVDDNDFATYKRLRRMGAQKDVDCMQFTNQTFVQDYEQRYIPTENEPKAAVVKEDNTLKYATVGLLTAGAVAGTALLLEDSSSSHDEHSEIVKCPVGQNSIDGVCVPIKCAPGTTLVGNDCVAIVCPDGQHLEGDTCVDNPQCPTGTRYENGGCQPIICPQNTHLVGNLCVADDGLDIDNQNDDDVYGINSEKENVYNLYSSPKYPDDQSTINLNNKGNGDGYGIFGKGNVSNAYVVGENEGIENSKPEGTGNLIINNQGSGDVYGVFSRVNVKEYKEAINAVGLQRGRAFGNITINNDGTGNVFGLFGDARAYNAYGSTGGEATGVINITSKGNIYGVGGYAAAANAVSPFFSHKVRGDININSLGDGEVYGLMVSKDNIPGAGAGGDPHLISWFSHNAYSSGGDEVIGNINIRNIGNGNVYGMQGGEQLFNTVVDRGCPEGFHNVSGTCQALKCDATQYVAGNECRSRGGCPDGQRNDNESLKCVPITCPKYFKKVGNECVLDKCPIGTIAVGEKCEFPLQATGTAKGTINIVNYGNGNVYGMFSSEPYEGNVGEVRPVVSNESVHGIDGKGSKGVINIVNSGNGVATGMRAGYGGWIVNSGEININNMGDGTAVGIYADNNVDVYNSGKINIYRGDYTDEGVLHKPSSAIGGTAYGIYAESGARIDNSGEITVTGAADGTGIYLEKGAVLENSGIVRFDGADNSIVTEGSKIEIYGPEGKTVNLDSFGGGEIILNQGGKFYADSFSGNMGVSEKVVLGSLKNQYEVKGALQSDNVDGLKLNSKSVMFEAEKYKNQNGGYDVTLTRRNMRDIMADENLAGFFEHNYHDGSSNEIFDYLKNAQTDSELDERSADVAGTDVIPSFRRENAMIYQNLNRQFSDNLFNKPDENYVGGYKYIDISGDTDGTLSGSDGTAHVAYGLLKDKTKNGLVYGLGASVVHLSSDYKDNSSRKSNMFGLWAPLGYDFNNGLRWYSKAYLGYNDGDYDRYTGIKKYSSDLSEYQYGLNNEIRYKMNLGHGITFEPLAELSMLGTYRDEIDEGTEDGAIKSKKENMLSLEGGIGAYLSKELELAKDSSLGFQIGGIYYVEFLDPDDGMSASMGGMDGRYNLSNKIEDSRAVWIGRARYKYKDVSVYGNIEKETNGSKALTVDAGVEYNF